MAWCKDSFYNAGDTRNIGLSLGWEDPLKDEM